MPTLIAPALSPSYKLPPDGTHVARCIAMVDLGTHTEIYLGESKRQRKLRLSFELPEERETFDDTRGGQPHVVSQEFTFSMHEKSSLRAFLQNWRGKPFTDDEARAFDIATLLGVPAFVNVLHTQSRASGKIYAKIASATRLPRRSRCPEQCLPSVLFSLSEPDPEIYETLPEWLRLKIADSEEYRALSKSAASPREKAGGGGPASANEQGDDDDDDDLPF